MFRPTGFTGCIVLLQYPAEGLKFLLQRNFGRRNAETWPEEVMHLSLQGCSKETCLTSTQCSRLGEGGDVLMDASSERASSLLRRRLPGSLLASGVGRASLWAVTHCLRKQPEWRNFISFYFFLFKFWVRILTNSWGGKSLIFVYRGAALNSTPASQQWGNWGLPWVLGLL